MAVRVGTSGWAYREWVGPFYPPGTSSARMLAFYATHLDAVEAHATYRRHPTAATLAKWASASPEGFRFAPKAHLGITHRRDLDGVEERVADFFAAVAPLGPRLGPVMFQLPHRQVDLERLDRLLHALPADVATAFELGPAWWVDDVLSRLERAGATLVLNDTDAGAPPDVEVGAVTYIRLRRTDYSDADLDGWAARLAAVARRERDVYAFVKHDEHGRAPGLARRLAEGATTS